MKKHNLIILSFFLVPVLLIGTSKETLAVPKAMITMTVVDEEGRVLPGVKVAIGFDGFSQIKRYNGYTDAFGKFSASNETAGGVSCAAERDGYYDSHGRFDFSQIDGSRWSPWNPEVKLILRKIEKPTPMYARNAKMSGLEIPAVGKNIGFDLMEYEWMPPYGKGKHTDLIFRLEKRFISEDNFESTLTITFPNRFDGIQLFKEDRRYGSKFKLPRFAPVTGYERSLVKKMKKSAGSPLFYDFKDDNNYIFRVRSEEKNNKLIRAMYGKIQGDIGFDSRFKPGASLGGFVYYLNPDHTRNLEYDPKRNLFQNLRSRGRSLIDTSGACVSLACLQF